MLPNVQMIFDEVTTHELNQTFCIRAFGLVDNSQSFHPVAEGCSL